MFGIDSGEMMILFVVALLLFGKRLPEVARTVGKGVADFKKGLAGIDTEVRNTIHSSYSPTPPGGSAPQPRPAPLERREDLTVPKFEPPKFEPGES